MTTDPVETSKGTLHVGQKVGYAPNDGMHRPATIVGFGLTRSQNRAVYVEFDTFPSGTITDEALVRQIEPDWCQTCHHNASRHERGRCMVMLPNSQCFCGDAVSEARTRALHNQQTTGLSYLSRDDA